MCAKDNVARGDHEHSVTAKSYFFFMLRQWSGPKKWAPNTGSNREICVPLFSEFSEALLEEIGERVSSSSVFFEEFLRGRLDLAAGVWERITSTVWQQHDAFSSWHSPIHLHSSVQVMERSDLYQHNEILGSRFGDDGITLHPLPCGS